MLELTARLAKITVGGKIAVDQVDPKLVEKVKQDRLSDTEKLVDVCRKICDKNKVW